MAIKATYCEVVERFLDSSYCPHTECRNIFKDPITDDGVKKSAKGLLCVDLDDELNYHLIDQCSKEQEQKGCLETVFKDGVLVKEVSLSEIRRRLK